MQRSFLKRHQQSNGDANGVPDRANNEATSNGEPLNLELDALIIGAGFAGVYLLHRLRQEGYKVKLVEAGSGLGRIWHFNNYPGARVDSQYPVYALSIPEVFNTWQWKQQYPGAPELQEYFQHIDKVLDISKDTLYNTSVSKLHWDDEACRWHVECDNGTRIRTQFLECCMGFAAKRHFPDWPGLNDFKGYVCHSSFWPVEGIDMRGKSVGVVGNGATGIQIAQESAKTAESLSVFIRTPNTCLPMNQRPVDKAQAEKDLEAYVPNLLQKQRFKNAGGFLYPNPTKKLFDDPPEVREKTLQDAWDAGGFGILFQYTDLLTNEEANRYVHDFWCSHVRARISDPAKRDILAPIEPIHPILGKRPSLEQDYYEQMSKPHVKLIDLRTLSIERVLPEGILTSDGTLHKLDILALATGFDSLTGGFTQIDIKGLNNTDLNEKWSTDKGALSYLGISIADFPNLFYTYGPHAPTAYGNGPSIVEAQAEWIVEVMNRMRRAGKTKINAKLDYELAWKKETNELHAATLRDKVDSWYMGTNIPGKPRQALNYAGGLDRYIKTCWERLDNNFEGFVVE